MECLARTGGDGGGGRGDVAPAAAASWQLLVDRIETTTDPRLRANLEVVARHVVEEVRGDVDALMETMVDEPVYEIFGASNRRGPQGGDEVREHYVSLVETGENRLEYQLEHVVVDDAAVVTDGTFRQAIDRAGLERRGLPAVGEADWWLVAYRCLVVWPISPEGLIEGELLFAGQRVVDRPLAQGEMSHLGPAWRT